MKRIIIVVLLSLISNAMSSQNKLCNCCTEKHVEFDFWIGSWTVTNPNGSAAGTNIIEKIQDNCVLRENWTSATLGYTGTSNNFYNAKAKQWEQIWVDNQGGSLYLKGNRIGNQMILKTDEEINKEGSHFFIESLGHIMMMAR